MDLVYYDAFSNSETEALQREDPALSDTSLPLGWKRRSHDPEEYFSCFVNEVTSEDNNAFDPRLTPTLLKQRGVDIQTFKTV